MGRTANLNTFKSAAGNINLTNEAKIPVITSNAPHFGLTLTQLGQTRRRGCHAILNKFGAYCNDLFISLPLQDVCSLFQNN